MVRIADSRCGFVPSWFGYRLKHCGEEPQLSAVFARVAKGTGMIRARKK
jgi:hypothetical protein